MGWARAAMLLAFVVAGCGARSGLTIPAPAPDAGTDALLPSDAGVDASTPSDVGLDAPSPPRDAGTDANEWIIGDPIPLGEPVEDPISTTRTPDSVLVAYAIHDHAERHVVALGLDGHALAPSRTLLPIEAADHANDAEFGPSVAWGAADGVVVASDWPRGCRLVDVDARGVTTGAEHAPGFQSCGLVRAAPNGFDVVTRLTAMDGMGLPPALARLDATGAPIATPFQLAPARVAHADMLADGDGVLFGFGLYHDTGFSSGALHAFYDDGSSVEPPFLVTAGAVFEVSWVRVATIGDHAIVMAGSGLGGAGGQLNLYALEHHRVGAGELGYGLVNSGIPFSGSIGGGLGDVDGVRALAAFSIVVDDDAPRRLVLELHDRYANGIGEAVEANRLPVLGPPDVVTVPDGLLVIYVGSTPDGSTTLYAQHVRPPS